MQRVWQPLSAADLINFNAPIEQRSDMDFHMKVFQQRDGRWLHCKNRLSRAFFL